MTQRKRSKKTLNETVWQFTDANGSFSLDNPGKISRLYFPLANEAGMLSNVTPKLKGSIQTGQDAFLTAPVSVEDLHSSKASRNFWVNCDGKLWSAAGVAKNKGDYKEKVSLEAGLLWHKLIRKNETLGLTSEILNFIPSDGSKVEVMTVTITNNSKKARNIQAHAAIPIYARSADNLRDHRHVTSLLHRIDLTKTGIKVTPTMTFDERGHHVNSLIYSVSGFDQAGSGPDRIWPTVESFIGEGGSFESPKALSDEVDYKQAIKHAQGKEAMGGMRFKKKKLAAGASTTYIVLLGIAEKSSDIASWSKRYGTAAKTQKALTETVAYWKKCAELVHFKTNETDRDGWLRWLGIQPTFRKIFGNSFLPDFDYGRGGRGWRDLWQDCLALLLTQPNETRQMLLHNFGGVRIDGSNATIIASKGYKFIADRNQITRTWMDHGVWPLVTTDLYIQESGDIDFLLKKAPYFRDVQQSRGKHKDLSWSEAYGTKLKTNSNRVYQGTLIEHILVQHLVQFFNVGGHNHIKLENADWNDGLDMAPDKGESVAFTAFYAGNLRRIGTLLTYLSEVKKIKTIEVAKELKVLFDTLGQSAVNYGSVNYKRQLMKKYFKSVQPRVSGKTVKLSISKVIADLNQKSDWMIKHIRSKEWIKTKSGHEFFNGYYDNKGNRVEGDHKLGVRMTLTGQVFPIMCGIATKEQTRSIIQSVKRYLKDKNLGGLRLNTDFKEIQPDLGRAFSFAYGEKENGAFFNHMQVMMANALYRQGFVEEGFEILEAMYKMCVDTNTSRIYPGLPEYFNSEGRGLYHYLTGSASWYFMTLLTESFGIKGHFGDLLLEPKLVAAQFNGKKPIEIYTWFAGKRIKVVYSNPERLSYGRYRITKASFNSKDLASDLEANDALLISRGLVTKLSKAGENVIEVTLGPKKKTPLNNTVYADPALVAQMRERDRLIKGAAKEKKPTRMPNLYTLSYKHY